jgi:hypothetical protein
MLSQQQIFVCARLRQEGKETGRAHRPFTVDVTSMAVGDEHDAGYMPAQPACRPGPACQYV